MFSNSNLMNVFSLLYDSIGWSFVYVLRNPTWRLRVVLRHFGQNLRVFSDKLYFILVCDGDQSSSENVQIQRKMYRVYFTNYPSSGPFEGRFEGKFDRIEFFLSFRLFRVF